jgi:hypothetical protein
MAWRKTLHITIIWIYRELLTKAMLTENPTTATIHRQLTPSTRRKVTLMHRKLMHRITINIRKLSILLSTPPLAASTMPKTITTLTSMREYILL